MSISRLTAESHKAYKKVQGCYTVEGGSWDESGPLRQMIGVGETDTTATHVTILISRDVTTIYLFLLVPSIQQYL